MVCSCVLYYDVTTIYYTKLFLSFSSELFLRTVLAHCSCALFLRTVLAYCSCVLFLRTVVIITGHLCPLYTVAQNGH